MCFDAAGGRAAALSGLNVLFPTPSEKRASGFQNRTTAGDQSLPRLNYEMVSVTKTNQSNAEVSLLFPQSFPVIDLFLLMSV